MTVGREMEEGMMRTRWIFLGVAASIAVLLAMGFAFASDPGPDPAQRMGNRWDRVAMAATCDSMQDSAAMQRLRESMAPYAEAQCVAMHKQMPHIVGEMDGMMGAGMLGGQMTGGQMAATGAMSAWMRGSGISGVGDTDGHHASMETWEGER
jgi:hypothetical protein